MDDATAQRALDAHLALTRIARHPEQDPAWQAILDDLREAEAWLAAIESRTIAQHLTYRRIHRILHPNGRRSL
jgi:hypothetical protein